MPEPVSCAGCSSGRGSGADAVAKARAENGIPDSCPLGFIRLVARGILML